MKTKKLSGSGWFALFSLLLSGCVTSDSTPYDNRETNFLGIYTAKEASFEPPRKTTLLLKSNELVPQSDYSGNKYEILWGLITITDY